MMYNYSKNEKQKQKITKTKQRKIFHAYGLNFEPSPPHYLLTKRNVKLQLPVLDF